MELERRYFFKEQFKLFFYQQGENLSNIMFLTVFTRAPPATFPRAEAKIKTINLPENVYVKKFYKIYPDSKYHDAIKYCRFFFVSQGGFFSLLFAMFTRLVLILILLLHDVLSCCVFGFYAVIWCGRGCFKVFSILFFLFHW